jgi:GNAT superfamily N-acetyltransferase
VAEEDWELLRNVRLAALRDAPWAFGSTHAREAAFDGSTWRERAGRPGCFVAVDSDEPVGIAVGLALAELPADERHLVSMWVAPRARGQGVGGQLVSAVAAWARAGGASRLSLMVVIGNQSARSVYLRAGFVPTGDIQRVLPDEPDRLEEQMVLDLDARLRL